MVGPVDTSFVFIQIIPTVIITAIKITTKYTEIFIFLVSVVGCWLGSIIYSVPAESVAGLAESVATGSESFIFLPLVRTATIRFTTDFL